MYDLGPHFAINQDKLQVNPKCVLIGEKYRIQVLTERLIRLEYNESGKYIDSATALVINRNFPLANFLVKEDMGYLYIETKYIKIKYLKNAKFTDKTLSATILYSKKEWFYTQKEVKNYGGTTISLDNTLKMPSYTHREVSVSS